MKRLSYILLLSLLALLAWVFVPRTYPVPPLEERTGTEYWDLSTGSKIAYNLILGDEPKQAYPIIYLHGGPGGPISNAIIQQLKPLAKEGYDLYFYDQIGGGHSDRLENIEEYTVDRHRRDLEEIIKKIEENKVYLIGQSWGAMLATVFVTEHTDQVEKIILTGPGPILPIRPELAHLKAPDSLELRAPIFSNREGNQAIHHLRSQLMMRWAMHLGRKLASDSEADDFATALNVELNKSTLCDPSQKRKTVSGAGFYAQIMTVKSFSDVKDQRSQLEQIKTPVLVLKGQCDNQKWGYTQEYLSLFSNHQFQLIPNAGHSIASEQPSLYLAAIRQFLSRVE